MDIDSFVRLLATYYRDEGETIARMHGKDARTRLVRISREIERLVNPEEPLLALWEDFKRSPDDYQSEMTELLDTFEDEHGRFRERLGDFLEGYNFGMENRSPVVRSDMVDDTDSDLYVRTLNTERSPEIPDTGGEPAHLDESESTGEEPVE